jgi:membrane fusion protein (multidrug efflux system)
MTVTRHLALLPLLSVVAACGHATAAADSAKTAADSQPVVGARTARATEGPFTVALTAIGTVAPRPGRYAELSAPAPTRVARIFVSPGDPVRAGAPLVEFERAPFDAAAASAQAALTVAERGAARAERLATAGILPRKDLDQAQADLAQARSTAIAANRAQQLATLHAPIAGVVTRMTAVLGAAVDPSQSLVAVADPTALDLAFSLSPSDGALVHPGASVSVTAGQATRGERLGDGVVTTVGEAVDTVTRAITARARLTHPARTLRIGETIVGRIAVAVHPHAVLVPVQALVPEGDSTKVFVVIKGVAHAQPVSVGGRTETVAEITDGVKAGDEIVTEGAYGMEDSAQVKTIP